MVFARVNVLKTQLKFLWGYAFKIAYDFSCQAYYHLRLHSPYKRIVHLILCRRTCLLLDSFIVQVLRQRRVRQLHEISGVKVSPFRFWRYSHGALRNRRHHHFANRLLLMGCIVSRGLLWAVHVGVHVTTNSEVRSMVWHFVCHSRLSCHPENRFNCRASWVIPVSWPLHGAIFGFSSLGRSVNPQRFFGLRWTQDMLSSHKTWVNPRVGGNWRFERHQLRQNVSALFIGYHLIGWWIRFWLRSWTSESTGDCLTCLVDRVVLVMTDGPVSLFYMS